MSGLEDVIAYLRSDRVCCQTLGDGSGAIVDVNGGRMLELNQSGLLIVERLGKGDSLDEIADAVVSAHAVDQATARRDLCAFLEQVIQLVRPM